MFLWQKRFNHAEQVAAMVPNVGLNDENNMVVTCMGVVYIEDEDLPHLALQLRRAAEMIERSVADRNPPKVIEKHFRGDVKYWGKYGVCPTCSAEPDRACINMRMAPGINQTRNTAHKGRPARS